VVDAAGFGAAPGDLVAVCSLGLGTQPAVLRTLRRYRTSYDDFRLASDRDIVRLVHEREEERYTWH